MHLGNSLLLNPDEGWREGGLLCPSDPDSFKINPLTGNMDLSQPQLLLPKYLLLPRFQVLKETFMSIIPSQRWKWITMVNPLFFAFNHVFDHCHLQWSGGTSANFFELNAELMSLDVVNAIITFT